MDLQPLDVCRANRQPGREPLRTFCEVALGMGLSRLQLQGHLSASRVPIPKPRPLGRGPKLYYAPSEFLTWWDDYQASQVSGGGTARG